MNKLKINYDGRSLTQKIRGVGKETSITSSKNWMEDVPSIGWWRVTTEGDCEGRSTKTLGTYYGHVAEIALSLAGSAFYSLSFSPVENPAPAVRPSYTPEKNNVSVQLDIKSGTWDKNGESRLKWVRMWLDADEDIKVTPSSYYASFTIELRANEEREKEQKRQAALAKLTEEEKNILFGCG